LALKNKQEVDKLFKEKLVSFEKDLLSNETNEDISSFFKRFFKELKGLKVQELPSFFKMITDFQTSLHDKFSKLTKRTLTTAADTKALHASDPVALRNQYVNKLIQQRDIIIPDAAYCMAIPKKKEKPEKIILKIKESVIKEPEIIKEEIKHKQDNFKISAETLAEITTKKGEVLKSFTEDQGVVQINPIIRQEQPQGVKAMAEQTMVDSLKLKAVPELPKDLAAENKAAIMEVKQEEIPVLKKPEASKIVESKEVGKEGLKEERFSRIHEYIEKDQKKGLTDVSL
jgi:hypothetical protein